MLETGERTVYHKACVHHAYKIYIHVHIYGWFDSCGRLRESEDERRGDDRICKRRDRVGHLNAFQ